MTKFNSFGFKPLVLVENKNAQAIYLCRWNGNEIVEVHTKETLYFRYKDTNLYDKNDKLSNYTIQSNQLEFYLDKYLDISKDDYIFLNEDFHLDNFTIRRIQ